MYYEEREGPGEVGHPLGGLAPLEYPFVAYFGQNEAMIRYSMTLSVVHQVQKCSLPVVAYPETNLSVLSYYPASIMSAFQSKSNGNFWVATSLLATIVFK